MNNFCFLFLHTKVDIFLFVLLFLKTFQNLVQHPSLTLLMHITSITTILLHFFFLNFYDNLKYLLCYNFHLQN